METDTVWVVWVEWGMEAWVECTVEWEECTVVWVECTEGWEACMVSKWVKMHLSSKEHKCTFSSSVKSLKWSNSMQMAWLAFGIL